MSDLSPERAPKRTSADHSEFMGHALGNRRGDVGQIPLACARQHGMCQRTRQISPDARLVAQILRLAVAAVEPRKGTEQPRVALRGYEA